MIKVTLINPPDCVDCKTVKTMLHKMSADYDLTIEEIETSSDKGHYFVDAYDIRKAPGILINDQYFSQGLVNEQFLRNKLDVLLFKHK